MKNYNRCVFVVLSVLAVGILCEVCHARAVTSLQIVDAVKEAEYVIIAKVVGRRTYHHKYDPIMCYDYDLEAVEVLKGDLSVGQVVAFDYCRHFSDDTKYLLFLNETNGRMVSWNDFNTHITLSDKDSVPVETSVDALQRVRRELCNNLASDSDKLVFRTISLMSRDQKHGSLSREEIDKYLLPLTESNDELTAVYAFSLLVDYGLTDYIPAALKLIEEKGSGKHKAFFTSLCWALRKADVPEKYLDMIGKFVDSDFEAVRDMATYVLRESKNKIAIPYLVRSIDDPSRHVRLNAAAGLSDIHNDIEAMKLFNEDEQAAAKYWQEKYPEYK